jgi:hypothetical protein
VSVSSPKESVYYYECSYGRFRLTYSIPKSELRKLVEKGEIKKKVLDDFPDGVDLRVGETDYRDFKESYGYRPEVDPEVAKKMFYSILTHTKNWKNFLGSGLIPAKDLKERIADIEIVGEEAASFSDFVLTSRKITEEKLPVARIMPERVSREKVDLKGFRKLKKSEAKVQKALNDFLQNVRPEGVDPKKTLGKQKFSKLEYTEGESIERVFARIQHKRLRREGEPQ